MPGATAKIDRKVPYFVQCYGWGKRTVGQDTSELRDITSLL